MIWKLLTLAAVLACASCTVEQQATETPVAGVSLRYIESNGIRMRIAEAGDGPVVLLAHGFPESWYSWRHQLTALAAAGFHAVAPDMRGYGGTDAPAAAPPSVLPPSNGWP